MREPHYVFYLWFSRQSTIRYLKPNQSKKLTVRTCTFGVQVINKAEFELFLVPVPDKVHS
jgi:hypothetical protein